MFSRLLVLTPFVGLIFVSGEAGSMDAKPPKASIEERVAKLEERVAFNEKWIFSVEQNTANTFADTKEDMMTLINITSATVDSTISLKQQMLSASELLMSYADHQDSLMLSVVKERDDLAVEFRKRITSIILTMAQDE